MELTVATDLSGSSWHGLRRYLERWSRTGDGNHRRAAAPYGQTTTRISWRCLGTARVS